MPATKNDLTRLIQFSLGILGVESAAVKEFRMFRRDQIKSIYSMTRSARKKLLEQRRTVDPIPIKDRIQKQYRNREQAQKMADIATDPSNR